MTGEGGGASVYIRRRGRVKKEKKTTKIKKEK
jgi:hypothetical protein